MRIAYVAQHGAGGNEDERHVAAALRELGHDVTLIKQTGSPAGVRGHDLLLGHHWYDVNPDWFASLDMPKAIWFFDKVWNGRERWVREIAPLCTRFFLTDATWAASAGIPTLRTLRQGVGAEYRGSVAARDGLYAPTVAHVGGLYGERLGWAKRLTGRYGGDFRAFQGVHGPALADLCRKTPIVVAPRFPSDDGYWSNRIYVLLGAGAFLIHPRLAALAGEYVDGIHYVGYSDEDGMFRAIDRFRGLPAERAAIALAGYERTRSEFTYLRRCQTLIEEITRPASTGTRASARRATATT